MHSLVVPRLRGWYRALTGTLRGGSGDLRPVEAWDVLTPTDCPRFHLEGLPDVPVVQPGLPFYLDLLDRRVGFAFVKRTHGFWDGLVFLCESAPEIQARVDRGEPVSAALVR